MSYIQHHKYLLLAFFALILVAGVSGYFVFMTHDTRNTTKENVTQNLSFDNEVTNNIQVNKEEALFVPSPLQGEGQDEVKSEPSNIQDTTTIEKSKATSTDYEILNPTTLTIADEKYTAKFSSNTTLYRLMQNLSLSSNKPFIFETKDYGSSMGHFVTEINGIKNDPQAGKYWIYHVNSEPGKIGISNYIIKKGDIIEWKYENSNM